MNRLAVLALVLALCLIVQSLDYDASVSNYMVNYAWCSNSLSENAVKSWTYSYCVSAQRKSRISDLKVFTDSKTNSLAFALHDQERNLNVISFRATDP